MTSLSWSQINAWRMRQHHLSDHADAKQALAVVSRLGVVQAQMMSAAELQLWARTADLKPADVQTALWQERTLIKTWAHRGTLHLLTAVDFPLYVAALGKVLGETYRKMSKMPSWQKYHGVTADGLEPIIAGIEATLADTPLTREQLADAVAAHTNMPELSELMRGGWGSLLKPAAVSGLLCFGPSEGQNVTFLSPQHWIGKWTQVDAQMALQELARRFLNTYGPATAEEFGRWIGMQPAPAKKIFAALGDEITPVAIDGWKAKTFALTSSLKLLASAEPTDVVRLLPNFDVYTLMVTPHADHLMDAKQKPRVYRKSAWISPVVLVGGRIEGIWEYEKKRNHIAVTVEPFSKLSKKVQRGIETEAQRLATFFDTADAQISYKS